MDQSWGHKLFMPKLSDRIFAKSAGQYAWKLQCRFWHQSSAEGITSIVRLRAFLSWINCNRCPSVVFGGTVLMEVQQSWSQPHELIRQSHWPGAETPGWPCPPTRLTLLVLTVQPLSLSHTWPTFYYALLNSCLSPCLNDCLPNGSWSDFVINFTGDLKELRSFGFK